MENRVAIISIIVEDSSQIQQLNDLLHRYAQYVVGRMGIPYRQKDINIICMVLDAPNDQINSLTGALGRIPGITAKATFSSH
ncbi:MAG: iron-only hydrogenase system regulator [Clostridia bacterium]|nr:iron-only hydrogenase system regulator [Clostridia bacterium]